MTTEPTIRTVWFAGRPYPIASHPQGINDPGTHWHLQTSDGEWHIVLRRRSGENDDARAWSDVMAAAQAWLADHYHQASQD